jgi:dTDP-4-dehydrorhamnose reductase/UDP-glucose 4-epimerase
MTIIVVGKSGFLAQALQANAQTKDWTFLSHAEALSDPLRLRSSACVINCAFSPALRTGAYNKNEDIDRLLASHIAGSGAHYIMLSSRAAYGTGHWDYCLKEEQNETPTTPYGRNKLLIERALRGAIGEDKVTILRLADIFGHERGRDTFFGLMLTRLADTGEIHFDLRPEALCDLLSAWRFADTVIKIAESPKPGLFNLGSGFGTPCGQIAEWVIEGYGQGKLIAAPVKPDDSFYLDMINTSVTFGLPFGGPAALKEDCILCGRQLRESKASD